MPKYRMICSFSGLLASALLFCSGAFDAFDQPAPTAKDAGELAVHLSLSKKKFVVGQQIPVRVEVENQSDKPFLIENAIWVAATGSASRIEFELTDSKGVSSPANEMISDSFSTPHPQANPYRAILESWTVLRPRYSICATVEIDESLLSFLGRPGRYRLVGTYLSTGLAYPGTYRKLGLSAGDIESMPYSSWSGKVMTNPVSTEILPKRQK